MSGQASIEASGTVTLGPSVVHEHIVPDLPTQVGAAPEAGVLRAVGNLRIQVGSVGRQAGSKVRGGFVHFAIEAAHIAADLRFVEVIVACTQRHGELLRYQVEVDRSERRLLIISTLEIVEEADIVISYAWLARERAGPRQDVVEAVDIHRRRTRRDALVDVFRIVDDHELLVVQAADRADAPVVGSAQANLMALVSVFFGILPSCAWRVAYTGASRLAR